MQWAVVRPDTLRDGEVTEYAVHESLVNSLSHPGETDRANVAHFMCELATDAEAWAAWRGKLPVIVNASPARSIPANDEPGLAVRGLAP